MSSALRGPVGDRLAAFVEDGVDAHRADAQHIHTAHRVAVDRGLVEAGQWPFGHDFFGAHQSLRLGNGNSYRPRGHRGGRYPGLLLLHRTHNRASLPSSRARRIAPDRRLTP